MNYPDSVRFLYSLGNEVKTAKYGLERIRTVLEALGNPERLPRIVHVAGTNGKGSTAAMIESGLRAAGLRTGLFTSPHLLEPTERIRINGQSVDASQFTGAFERVHACAEELIDGGAIDFHPTYFETVTAMALLLLRELRAETTVLEVGLGGRLDATNVVLPELCVITPIDFDHEALLGKSLEAIASEKAGILKPGIPAVFAGQRPEAQATLERRAAELAVPVTHVEGKWHAGNVRCHPRGSNFSAVPAGTGAPIEIECPLAGRHQVVNALTAIAALHELRIPNEAIQQGIASVCWPGRLQHVSDSPEIILDGAHNPAGARSLADYIACFYSGRRPITIIYGAMRDKAVAEMSGILFPLADRVIATAPRQARAAGPETIREFADHQNLAIASDLLQALALARAMPAETVIFITGSLFLVGEALELLNG